MSSGLNGFIAPKFQLKGFAWEALAEIARADKMTEGEFRNLLAAEPLAQVVEEHIFQGPVHFFRGNVRHYELLRDNLVPRLQIASPTNLRVVGSAKLGFSLDPDAFPRAFSPESDIDVLVVDEATFDSIWFGILDWHYRQPERLVAPANDWARQRRYDVYWGCFQPARLRAAGIQDPTRLRQLRDLSYRWFHAFQSLTRLAPFAGRKVTGHLYRTWTHALLYQVSSLMKIKEALQL